MMKTEDVVPHIKLPVLPPIMAHSIVHSGGETALRDWYDHMQNLFTTGQEKLDSAKEKIGTLVDKIIFVAKEEMDRARGGYH
mmetsp:Transcript_29660/g.45448  ORF Transcript_29660/g.45448 Transcript_29660/m.45448 type:complete len:82 (+) Transcript_29660:2071-2316(+)